MKLHTIFVQEAKSTMHTEFNYHKVVSKGHGVVY